MSPASPAPRRAAPRPPAPPPPAAGRSGRVAGAGRIAARATRTLAPGLRRLGRLAGRLLPARLGQERGPLLLSLLVALGFVALTWTALSGRGTRVSLGDSEIRVRLDSLRGEKQLEFTGVGLRLGDQRLGSPVELRLRSGGLDWTADGRSGSVPLPCALRADGRVRLTRRKGPPRSYPGLLRFAAGADWSVVAPVPCEDYVAGVVMGELGPRFAPAALAAQAVAARSYAASYVASAGTREHHLLDTTRSQVFAGLVDDPACVAAARATRGLVLVRGGRPLRAYYSSTCGGATACSRDKFADVPADVFPCQPCDDCRVSPVFHWQEDAVATEDLLAALPAVRPPLAAIEAETVDGGGRWLKARVRGSGNTSAVVAGWELRRLLHLRSDLLDTVEVAGSKVAVHGRGYGHGVGLCQWGAEGMARRGATWQAILQRYFPGAALATVREVE